MAGLVARIRLIVGACGVLILLVGQARGEPEVGLANGGPTTTAPDAMSRGPDSQPDDVAALGLTPGKPVLSGCVFVGNRYFEPPYEVTRRGLDILINGERVDWWKLWPLPKAERVDPGPPPNDLREDSQYEDAREYLSRKVRFLGRKRPTEAAVADIVQAYKALPFVKTVTKDAGSSHPFHYVVETVSGRRINVDFTPAEPGSLWAGDWTGEQVAKALDERRQRFEECLQKGSTLFFFGEYGGTSMWQRHWPQLQSARYLKVTVQVWRSDRPVADKVRLMQCLGVLRKEPSREMVAAMNRLEAGPALDKYIEQSSRKVGVEPMRLEDVPPKPDWELRPAKRPTTQSDRVR